MMTNIQILVRDRELSIPPHLGTQGRNRQRHHTVPINEGQRMSIMITQKRECIHIPVSPAPSVKRAPKSPLSARRALGASSQ
ncbi:hypothetical protein BDV23DRAFT_136308 [Aspergillus alliaceus]|uniref:Uncharacterized protein n=1 Tax=Petromyces alliaceus TaxID=209559 RepID=A0A5N7BYE1_PETAA|nr:hypothetical protein BDV23DRAFT_136308 [Aspergillus alliaceus]